MFGCLESLHFTSGHFSFIIVQTGQLCLTPQALCVSDVWTYPTKSSRRFHGNDNWTFKSSKEEPKLQNCNLLLFFLQLYLTWFQPSLFLPNTQSVFIQYNSLSLSLSPSNPPSLPPYESEHAVAACGWVHLYCGPTDVVNFAQQWLMHFPCDTFWVLGGKRVVFICF